MKGYGAFIGMSHPDGRRIMLLKCWHLSHAFSKYAYESSKYAHVGKKYAHTHTMQAYVCTRILMPRNPNFEFSDSFALFVLHHMPLF